MSDAAQIPVLVRIGSDPSQLQAIQNVVAEKPYAYDREQFPRDACAITQSLLFQAAGIHLGEIYGALDFDNTLKQRGWAKVNVGSQRPGDIGTTCKAEPHHGTDHVYLVIHIVDTDTMTIADNQARLPHTRWVHGRDDLNQSPTTYFLRAV